MADPITAGLGIVGMGSSILGGLTSAAGAEKAGAAQEMQNYYQAGLAKFNAQIALQNRDYALNQGEQQATIRGLAGGQTMGAIRAAEGSSGFDINTGSHADVQKGQQFANAQDLAQIRSNAAKTAYDYSVQSTQFDQQAKLYEMAGTDAAKAGQIKAEASIISTAGSVADKWTQGSQVGLLSGVGKSISSTISGLGGAGSNFSIGSLY